MKSFGVLIFLIGSCFELIYGQGERPFPDMPIFQKWQCEDMLYDPKRQHYPYLMIRSDRSKIIRPVFFSAIDSRPYEVDESNYYRYWPLLEDSLSYDSLIKTPALLQTDEPIKDGLLSSFHYLLFREENSIYYGLSPYVAFCRNWLSDSLDKVDMHPNKIEALQEQSQEFPWLSMDPNEQAFTYRVGSPDRSYYSEQYRETVWVFSVGIKSYAYNTIIKELHFTGKRGLIELLLGNYVLEWKEEGGQNYHSQRCRCWVEED